MKTKWFSIAALTISLAAPAGMLTPKAYAAGLPPAAGFYQERPWDTPPEEYKDAQRQGFHEGIEAARHDWERHTSKDADDHDRYRHPPVEKEFTHDYRDAFKRGYSEAMHHMKDEHKMDRDHDDHDRPY
jgi:hypothetical protein